ncbi:MAG: cupredoxin domain-containing protein [Spirochaetota bacterium]
MKRALWLFPLALIVLAVSGLPAGSGFSRSDSDTVAISDTVTIDLQARNNAFDRETVTVPAGARVIITFVNRDRIPHNVSVYETEQARKVIYFGRIINGSESVRYELTAPERAGVYFFRCDLHPRRMTGSFVVQ